MAAEIGVASNHLDLIQKIRNFLTSNSELVAAGQNWEHLVGPTGVMAPSDAVTLRGPGWANDADIYITMYMTEDNLLENWRLSIYGHGGYIPGQNYDTHPLTSPITRVAVWNQPMNYWIAGDGRSFGLVVQVSTVFTSGVWGYGLPNTLKKNYPKPFIVAGCMTDTSSWTSTNNNNRFISDPGYNCAFVLYPENVWRRLTNYNSSGSASIADAAYVYPGQIRVTSHSYRFGGAGGQASWMPTVRGKYIPRRIQVKSNSPFQSNLFQIDRMFAVSGRQGISSGSILEYNGEDYLAFQNLFRTGFADYMLMRLS